MDSDERDVSFIENLRARLKTLIRVEPVLDRMHSIDHKQKELIGRRAREEGEREAADLLINAVVRPPRAPGWFREFVDALSAAGCRHAADYMDDRPPAADVEAENDNHIRLIELLSPSLLDIKTGEVCGQCFSVGILAADDVEKINAETTNHGNQCGARELLRRIVRSPPGWFSDFLAVLHTTEHYTLHRELSGVTNDEKVPGSVPREAGPAVEDSSVVGQELLDLSREGCVDLYNEDSRGTSPMQEDSDRSLNLSSDSLGGGGDGGGADRSWADGEGADGEGADGGGADGEGADGGGVISLRPYQAEVAAPALAGANVIICLPTGSGKTRVAVYITGQHLDARLAKGQEPGKVVVLVNKIPLVEQHYSSEFAPFLRRFKVGRVSGNSQLKISFPDIVRNHDVIICTAQILENHLEGTENEDDERVELSDLTLLVIDECHHTQKGGVYNNIMTRYLKQKYRNLQLSKQGGEPLAIPQVLGLTASPGVGGATKSTKAEEHILKICANLDACKIMTSSSKDTDKDLYKKVSIVEERRKDPFGDVIKAIMTAIHLHADLHSTCDFGTQNYEQWVVQREYNAAKEEDQKVRVCAEHLRRYNEGLQLSNVIRMCDALEVLSAFQEEEMRRKEAPEEETPIQVTDTERFLFKLFREKRAELEQLVTMPEFENSSLSTLRTEILKEFTNRPDARGIIFTKTRRSAMALTQWVQGNAKFAEVGVQADYVIGGGDQSSVKPMTSAEQKDVLNKFGHGGVNLLIATTVAEEGLDISACNFVIRYGLVTNEISMIQAQGRARAENSSYTLVAVPGSGVVEKELVNEFRQKMMNKAILKIKNMDQEEFKKKITNYQLEAIQERKMLMNKKKKKKQNDSPSEVSFSCRGCNKEVCRGEDIEVVSLMHHVVVSTEFRSLYNKKDNTNLQERLVEYETNQFVACKACGQRWGAMMLYHAIELPSLHVKNLVVTYKGKKISKCTKWKELDVLFPAFDLSAHASLVDQALDSD